LANAIIQNKMTEVLTPQDLLSCEFETRFRDTNPPYFAVFGKPIAHSMSPLMQNAALEELAKTSDTFINAKYMAFEVSPDELVDVLPIFWEKNFLGINLTIPHKEVVMGHLKNLDSSAANAGACNTLLRVKDGWKGFNTDGFGLEAAIQNAFGVNFKNADVMLLGAGGAARGAAFHIASCGCKTLSIANRSVDRLEKLVGDLQEKGINAKALSLADCAKYIQPNSIVINATSIGLKDADSAILDFGALQKSIKFFDMPYRKGCPTVSVQSAQSAGIKAQSGLPMLAWQGAKSLSIWTGADVDKYAKIMLETLNENSK